jgi:tetratricopeptide (TPR) repeat protein
LRFRFLSLIAAAGLSACVAPAPPESVVGDYLAARLAAYSNDIEGAAGAFSAAREKAPGSPEINRNAFYFHLAAGDFEQAMAIAEKLAKDPNAGDGGFAKGVLAARALKGGRYGAAERLIGEAADAGFPRAAANIVAAWAVAGNEGEAAALEQLRNAPGDEYRGFYPLHAALLSENLGRPEDARSAYQLSIMAFSGSAEIDAYGAFLEREGDAVATREFYELLASQEGVGRFAGRAGLARLDQNETPPAFRGVTPSQGAAIALYSLASGILQDTYQRREAAEKAGFRVGEADYNLSLAMTQLALYLNPGFDDARRFAGSILNVYGEHEAAISMLSMVDRSSPYYEQARIEIASAYNGLEETDRAVETLKSAIRNIDGALDARLSLAGLYASDDKHREAVSVMDDVIAMLPEEPLPIAWRYYLTRAASLIEIDEWPRAETDLKRAVEIAPQEATALNYLGYSWAERGENLEEAFELIEQAVALDPSSGAIIDSLGWAHYQLGDYEQAVGHLEQAASLEPGDPTITDHLGDVYWRLGRRLEARYQWRRVLELEPDEDQSKSAREKILRGLPVSEKKK